MSDENQNNPLKNILKGLPKVKAKDDFEIRLMKRLREAEDEKFRSPALNKLLFTKKRFSLSSLLRPSLAPAIGLTIVLLVFIAYYINISIIQKSPVKQEISQNQPDVQKEVSPPEQNNESRPPISSGELKSSDKNSDQSVTPSITGDKFGNDYYAPSTKESDKNLEQEILTPKAEQKKTDELRSTETEHENTDIKEKKADDYIMKKSGDYQYKDTGKQNELDQEGPNVDEEKGYLNANERSLSKDTVNKNDSLKGGTKKDRKVSKGRNYNDTVKSQIETNKQIEDTTKNRK